MTGFLTRAALALEPSGTAPIWPAASPVAAATLLPLLSENVREVPATRQTARRHPRTGHPAPTQQATRIEGPMSLIGVYDGLSEVWAMALGLLPADQPTLLTTGVYQHIYEIDAQLNSHAWPFGAGHTFGTDVDFNQQLVRRATLCVDRSVSCWEHLSTMVRSLTLYASPAGVTLLLNLVAHSTDRASATNPNLDALSIPDWPKIDFHHLEFRLAAFSASTALDSDDAITLTGLRLDLSQHLKTRQRKDTGLYIGEPRREAHPEVSGSFTVPSYSSDALIDWARDNTLLMAEARFTGPEIGSTGYYHTLTLWLPALTLKEPEAGTQGPEDRDQSFNWTASVPEATPAGFPTPVQAGPLYVELQSSESSHPLL